MNWSKKSAEYADMIRVKHGSIYHYGVFVNDDEIIQFGLAPMLRVSLPDSQITVCTTDIATFLCGEPLEVAELDDSELSRRRNKDETVLFARQKLGTGGYSILYNNCEHFAYECVMGKKYSSQTDDVRAIFRNLAIVDVYVMPLPKQEDFSVLYPQEREREVQAATDLVLKRQLYYSWKLFEYALGRSFGVKIQNLTFSTDENGALTTQSYFFSISYAENAIAVAVSKKEIDITVNKLSCNSQKTDNSNKNICTKTVIIENESYVLTVFSENVDRLRVFDSIDFEKITR